MYVCELNAVEMCSKIKINETRKKPRQRKTRRDGNGNQDKKNHKTRSSVRVLSSSTFFTQHPTDPPAHNKTKSTNKSAPNTQIQRY